AAISENRIDRASSGLMRRNGSGEHISRSARTHRGRYTNAGGRQIVELTPSVYTTALPARPVGRTPGVVRRAWRRRRRGGGERRGVEAFHRHVFDRRRDQTLNVGEQPALGGRDERDRASGPSGAAGPPD